MSLSKEELALELHKIGALKFGEFTFKSGIKSPIYMDLRLFVSYPKLLKKTAKLYAELIKDVKFDRIVGVAYAALPIAGAVSLEMERPWIFVRKEALAKAYGLEKAVEGEYRPGEQVIVIEDLVTRGTSIMEVIPVLSDKQLKVTEAAFLIDYGKGGIQNLADHGVKAHFFMSMKEVVNIMSEHKVIDEAMHAKALEFLDT